MADVSGFFFNVEKWFGSVAVQRMSFSEKGVYFTMMLQQWRDSQRNLPDDMVAVAELIAVTPAQVAEVEAAWPTVRRKFVTSKHDESRIYNIEIEHTRRKQRANFRNKQKAGQVGGKASARKRQTPHVLPLNDCLSTAQRSSTDQSSTEKSRSDQSRSAAPLQQPIPDARSKRPIYTSDRFVVFEWQLDELGRILGAHFDDFDLHAFFDSLCQSSRASGLVIPREGVWEWLQAQVLAEARRRGFPIASAAMGKQTTRLATAVANIAREEAS